jgi:LysM repeat protein
MDDMAWSPYMTTYGAWQEISVEATVPAGYVTVYIFGTQDAPKRLNQVYMDQASLKVVATGQSVTAPTAAAGSTSAPVVPVVPTTRPQVYAPSVAAQDTDKSDGIIHTVQSGDTLAAIAVAYRTTVTNILEINGLERGAMLALGQKIIIERPGESPADTEDPTTEPADTAPDATVPSETIAMPTNAPNNTAAEPTTSSSLAGNTAVPEPAATEEAAATTAPTDAPTNTPVPPATEVAALPTSTVAGTSVADAVTSLEAGVCVTLFNDENQNRIQDQNETVLPGGIIVLKDLQGKEVAARQTTEDSTPFCFTDVAPATYNLVTTPPAGYGLTTTNALTVKVQVGAQFQVNIGAAQGVTPLATPTPDTAAIQTVPDADTTSPNSGALVLVFVGLIAVVAIGAGILLYVIRRL